MNEIAHVNPDDPYEVCAVWGYWLWTLWTERLARPSQIPGKGNDAWRMHFLEGGRGSGKTRCAAEWAVMRALRYPNQRGGVIGMDFTAVVETCFFGESGIANVIPDANLYEYQKGKRTFKFHNGSEIRAFTSERPKKLRGPQFHFVWGDEPAEWFNAAECLDNARGAIRLPGPEPAQAMMTGTPKAVAVIDKLHAWETEDPERYTHSNAAMADNIDNLDPDFVESMMLAYPKGTAYHEQEILGKRIEQAEGALWQGDWIRRVSWNDCPAMTTIALAIDPADSDGGDEAGMIVGGQAQNDMYVFADYTRHASTLEWAEAIPDICSVFGASKVVVEGAFLGKTARTLLDKVARNGRGITVEILDARGDKVTRATPVAALYEAGRCIHVDGAPGPDLNRLEGEMKTWEPGVGKSPNRVDALAYLGRFLLLESIETSFGSASRRRR